MLPSQPGNSTSTSTTAAAVAPTSSRTLATKPATAPPGLAEIEALGAEEWTSIASRWAHPRPSNKNPPADGTASPAALLDPSLALPSSVNQDSNTAWEMQRNGDGSNHAVVSWLSRLLSPTPSPSLPGHASS